MWLQDPSGEHTWLVQCDGKCSERRLSTRLTAGRSYTLAHIKESVGGNMLKDHGSSH